MNRGALSLNIRYCLIHLFYWVAYVALISFASVYFLDKGLSNTMIGFILAGGNICSVILQPVIATMLDDHPELSIKQVVATLFLLMLVLSVAVQMLDLSKFALGTLVVLLLTMFLSASPLINTLAFQRGAGGECQLWPGKRNWFACLCAGRHFCGVYGGKIWTGGSPDILCPAVSVCGDPERNLWRRTHQQKKSGDWAGLSHGG